MSKKIKEVIVSCIFAATSAGCGNFGHQDGASYVKSGGWEEHQTYYCYIYPPGSSKYVREVTNRPLAVALSDSCRWCKGNLDRCDTIKCEGQTIYDTHYYKATDCR
ncbi:MAG: hypothetical protein HQK54_16620 [Oligoflexales bacterium]|nr:hypothetical protein [Oligoflexales bacterium]